MVRRRTWLVILVAIVLIGATAAYGVLEAGRPQVESVDNEWGSVTDDRTEVETRIAIDNPRLLRLGDAAADVSYTVSMNDIEVANEHRNRMSLADDDSTVTVSTWLDNDDIPAWWASHIGRNETTTVRVNPSVGIDVAGIQLPATGLTGTRTVQTNLLEPIRTNESQRLQISGRTMFVINETNAQWGKATANRTPIDASATVTNQLSIPVPITEIRYSVELNGIAVGQGVAAQQTVLKPDSTRPLEANATIDNSRLDDWWVTHLRNEETSNLTVEFDATIEYGGVTRTLPLEFLSYERTFETDLFGTQPNRTNDSSPNRSRAVRDEQSVRVWSKRGSPARVNGRFAVSHRNAAREGSAIHRYVANAKAGSHSERDRSNPMQAAPATIVVPRTEATNTSEYD
ncbi:LEA type 2 family protein [Natrinema halophilum]|uniref:LEA type 2 family protein n=1 Tax=Natrinema halophilum TaxID=1699371 RepID=A0A7D5KRH5_9EURY|nr:LEA type 2 family protein [Natrinema halophilum]QLG49337.1 LEA type 2 family protein [Natrinema halophilum]